MVLAAQAFPSLSGTLVVANQQSHSASLISLKDGHTVATLETGVGPHEAAVSPDGKTAVVSQYGDRQHVGNTLVVIDIPTAKIVKTVSTGDATRPHGIAFLDNDTVLATSETTQRLVVVNLKAEKVDRSLRTDQPGTHLFALPSDHKLAYAASIPVGIVTKLDVATGTKEGEATVGKGSEGIGISPDGRWVVTGNRGEETLSLVDTVKMTVDKTLPAPGIPYRVAFTPDNKRFLVCNPGSGGLMAFGLDKLDAPKSIKIDGAPGGIAIEPKGRYAFVTVLDKAQVAIVDLQTDAVVATTKTEQSPDGIAYSPVETKA
jgi:DNA-binding beta-propeller fold protein YncE